MAKPAGPSCAACVRDRLAGGAARSDSGVVRGRDAGDARWKKSQRLDSEQKITLAEAIEAYTLGSAYAEFTDEQKGSLTPGKLADVVILDTDLFAVAPEKIKDAKVAATIVGGKTVYSRQ